MVKREDYMPQHDITHLAGVPVTAAVPEPVAHRDAAGVLWVPITDGAAVPDPRFRDQLAEEFGRHQGLRGPMDDERPDVWQNRCECGWDDGDERPGWRERYRQHIADALMEDIAAEVEARVQAAAKQRGRRAARPVSVRVARTSAAATAPTTRRRTRTDSATTTTYRARPAYRWVTSGPPTLSPLPRLPRAPRRGRRTPCPTAGSTPIGRITRDRRARAAVSALECDGCGLAAMDLPDEADPEFIFERGGDGVMRCQGCQHGPGGRPTDR